MTHLLQTRTGALAAASLFVLGASCGSSSSGQDDQGPGFNGELPATFSVFLSDRGPNGLVRPVFVNPETGESRRLGNSLASDERLNEGNTTLSPDGRFLATSTTVDKVVRPRIVDVRTGAVRTLVFPSGQGGPSARGGDLASITFSPDSRRMLTYYDYDRLAVADASGANVRQVDSGASSRDSLWLPVTDRFAARTYDAAADLDRVTIYDAETLAATNFIPLPGQDLAIDNIMFSKDESIMVVAGELGTSNGDELEVVAINLGSGQRTSWRIDYGEDDEVKVSDNGAYVAVATYSDEVTPPRVWLCEVATGATQLATLPTSEPDEVDIEDFQFEPSGERLTILSDHRLPGMDEVTLAGFNATSFLIEPSVPADGETDAMTWAPGGRWIVYQREDPSALFDLVQAFDADSNAMPVRLSDGAEDLVVSGFQFSPDGARLLTTQINTIAELGVGVLYDVGAWSEPTFLDGSFAGGGASADDLLRGRTSAAFSSDGRSLYWLNSPQAGDPQKLVWLALDAPLGTVPSEFLGSIPSGTAPSITSLWAR